MKTWAEPDQHPTVRANNYPGILIIQETRHGGCDWSAAGSRDTVLAPHWPRGKMSLETVS